MFSRSRPIEPIPVRPPQVTDGIIQAKEAQARARQGFLDAVDSGTEVRQAADRMHSIRRRNHWGELIERTILS